MSFVHRFPRSLTTVVAAAAVVLAGLTAGARPARADAEDILRFLAGAAIVAAIVRSVDDNHRPQYISRTVLPDSCLESVRVDRRTIEVYSARCLDRGGYSGLPNHCYREFRVNGNRHGGYVSECLWDAGYRSQGESHYQRPAPVTPRYGWLPSHCEMTYRTGNRRIDGYWAGCLRTAGVDNLPRDCRVTSTGGDNIYNAQCLSDAGFRRR